MDEFSLIDHYFKPLSHANRGMVLGVGDDAALLQLEPNHILAVSTDTLISGRHFPTTTLPADMAYKAIMVNASDLAAMGAIPRWFLLSLTLPDIEGAWLRDFTQGLQSALSTLNSTLIGGDTTRGPMLSLTIQALGVLEGKAMLRSGAKVGDHIFVTGNLGAAAFALSSEGQSNLAAQKALNRPLARCQAGMMLKSWASSAIDISDGLAQDLGHILKQSHVGARIDLKNLPLAPCLQTLTREAALDYALSGGDDYELLCTVPAENIEKLKQAFVAAHLPLYEIGEITADLSLQLLEEKGQAFLLKKSGYTHF